MKFNSYPHYKDSKIEWIGEIPDHWEVKRIADIYIYRNEKVSDKDFKALSVTKKGIVPQLENAAKTIHGDDRKRVEISDFVINSRSDRRGSCGVSKYSGSVSLICHVLENTDDEFDADYGHFLFRNEMFSQEFYRWGRGIVDDLWSTRWSDMKKIMLPFPPMYEQIAISDFLIKETPHVDLTIEKYEKLIKLLKEKRIALISHVVTKGLNKDVEMKDSGVEWIGEIPEHWAIGRMGIDCRIKARLGWKGLKASEYVEKGYIFLSTPNIKNTDIDFKNVNYITEERYVESPEIMLKENDVLLAKDGSTLGTSNVVRYLPAPTTVNSSIAVIKPKNIVDGVYLHYFISSHYMQNIIHRIKEGMGVPHLFQADIRKFFIFKPPLSEQKDIAKYLDIETSKIEKLIQKIQSQITLLKEYKISLISHAVTGKIDVREQSSK